MLMKLQSLQLPEKFIGIDLGTSKIRIWSKRKGMIFDEPSCIAISSKSDRVLAVGKDALEMEGKVGDDVEVHWLVKDSEMIDTNLTNAFFKSVFKKLFGEFILIRPTTMISIPTDLSQTKKDLLAEVFSNLGLGDVHTISQPLVAAIGAGVPVADSSGCFIIQLGAGTVEGAVISLGRVVLSDISFQGGNYLSEKIAWEIKKNTLIDLGKPEVEHIKKEMNFYGEEEKPLRVTGNNLKTKSPKEIEVNREMVEPVILGLFSKYKGLLMGILSDVPPELTTDIIDKGLLLSGGLAQLNGLEDYLTSQLKIPVSVVDDPDLTTIKGIGMVLENLDLYKESLGYVN